MSETGEREIVESSTRMRLAERYLARAIYNMSIAPRVPDEDLRFEVYKASLRFLKLAEDAIDGLTQNLNKDSPDGERKTA